MKRWLFLLVGLGASHLGGWADAPPLVRVVKLPVVRQLLARPGDTTYVVNFWATWCKPCVAELPGFEQVAAAHHGQPVRVVLVSLDFPSLLTTKVQPYVARQRFASPVWLLAEADANAYINAVDPTWSGALPFTVVFNNARHRRQTFERPLAPAELEAAVQTVRQ